MSRPIHRRWEGGRGEDDDDEEEQDDSDDDDVAVYEHDDPLTLFVFVF